MGRMLLLADMAASYPVRYSRFESLCAGRETTYCWSKAEEHGLFGCEVIAPPFLEVTIRVRVGVRTISSAFLSSEMFVSSTTSFMYSSILLDM
jgi:hypothetical protein